MVSLNVYAQQDTTVAEPFNLLSDTVTVIDTLARRFDVDTVIYASSSDSLIFYINKKMMYLYGNSELQYKDTDLKSANIFVDFETSNIEATGNPSDTARRGYTGTPILVEGGEKYEGIRMKYNFRTQRGHISSAGTEMEGATYTGARIKKVDTEIYFIEDGIYTTCPLEIPHYHFYSNEMKVIHREQIVSKWIWLNFGGVPFPIPIPFAVFPIESGRRSGLLAPAFGDDPSRGRYFSRFGYFWAISDYMDWNVTGDYYTRGSYNLSSVVRYAQRYSFTGNLNAGYNYERINEPMDRDFGESTSWRIRWNHNQSFNPTTRLDANLEFMSSANYLTRNVIQLSELLRNKILSNATLHKSWDESGNSMSISYSRSQEIETGNVEEILPNLRFNMAQAYPFRSPGSRGEWYESFGYQYSGEFRNNRNKLEGDLRIRGGINHSINTSFAPKFGYFNFTPYFRYQERWYNKRIEQYYAGVSDRFGNDSIITEDVREINFVRTFNSGVSASTRFFGIVQPNTMGIAALRHSVQPTVTYNFTPDYSKPFWDYYGTYTNSRGEEVMYNRYQREVFGGPGRGEQQSLSLSIGNIFEMKTMVDLTDTTAREQKITLLNLDISSGYNFAADSFNIAPVNINARTQIGDWFSLQGRSSFTPYQQDESGRSINQLLWNTAGVPLRLVDFGFSVSTSLSGERIRPAETETVTAPEDEFQLGAENRVYQGIYDERQADFTIPWDISLTYNYNFRRSSPAVTQQNSNLSGGLNFNLTPAWKFSFSGSYDIERKEIAAPSVRISRDLHCWLMNFTWYPIGRYRGYQFEIRVKAPQLQDLKITKRDSFFSGK
jgi:lipopolysaccharide assembly outer membrane protein LptD (OstA)